MLCSVRVLLFFLVVVSLLYQGSGFNYFCSKIVSFSGIDEKISPSNTNNVYGFQHTCTSKQISVPRNFPPLKMESSENGDLDVKSSSQSHSFTVSPLDYVWIIAVLPLASVIFPFLLDKVTNFELDTLTRQNNILYLLLSKRIYLYSLAISAVVLGARRSISASSGLGQRIMEINSEVFRGLADNYTKFEQEGNKEIYQALDEVQGTTQALALPVILGISLVASFVVLGISATLSNFEVADFQTEALSDNFAILELVQSLREVISTMIPIIFFLSNAAVCWLFAKVELQSFLKSTGLLSEENDVNKVGLISALTVTIPAVLSSPGGFFWPLQNFLNICIAITVTRAVQLPRLPFIVLALTGLAVYDVVSVVGTQQFTDGGRSIMEAVAVAKIAGSSAAAGSVAGTGSPIVPPSVSFFETITTSWRPGLLEVVVGGRVSDALGLGDVIFPSILAGWALRYDSSKTSATSVVDDESPMLPYGNEEKNRGSPFFGASVFGYALGCILCEVFQTGQGQPALLYIVPAMFASLGSVGLFRREISEMWTFDPARSQN